MEKVLITGATGFLGRALVEKFINTGYEVTVLIRNPDKMDNQEITVYKINLENSAEIKETIVKNNLIDSDTTVIHCAAVLGAAQASKKTYIKINVDASIALFEVSNSLGAKNNSYTLLFCRGAIDRPVDTK